MADKMKDLIIIGSGPAGLSAAVYAQRAMLDQVVIEKGFSGGQIVTTEQVDNYLGLYGENGYDLAMRFKDHADQLGVPFLEAEVTQITDSGDHKEVHLEGGEVLTAKSVILATGANHKPLGVPGETEFSGAGVSYCATCDGAFFRNRTVAVVGGGDVALEDALYLSKLCEKVYLIHRRDELRGAKLLQQRVFDAENIEFLGSSEITQITGSGMVEQITVADRKSSTARELAVSGVFIAVGMEPQNALVQGLVALDDAGYIIAGEDCRTSVPGIYAVGDIRTKQLRQVVTAVADGAVAVSSLEQDLLEQDRNTVI